MKMRFKINENKKGVELTLQTVIIFIILLIVFIVMIYFFVNHYGGGINNFETISNQTLSEYAN